MSTAAMSLSALTEGLLHVEDGQELLKTCRDVAGECVSHCLDLSIVEREMDVRPAHPRARLQARLDLRLRSYAAAL
jgi:hypothetical protein